MFLRSFVLSLSLFLFSLSPILCCYPKHTHAHTHTRYSSCGSLPQFRPPSLPPVSPKEGVGGGCLRWGPQDLSVCLSPWLLLGDGEAGEFAHWVFVEGGGPRWCVCRHSANDGRTDVPRLGRTQGS